MARGGGACASLVEVKATARRNRSWNRDSMASEVDCGGNASAARRSAVFMFIHPTRRKTIQASQAEAGTHASVAYCCLAPPSGLCAPTSAKEFLTSCSFQLLFSNVPRSKNRYEAHAQSALGYLATLWEKVPGHRSQDRTFSNEPP